MFAGRMKLNTFLLLVGAGAGAAATGVGAWFLTREPAAIEAASPAQRLEGSAPARVAGEPATATPAATGTTASPGAPPPTAGTAAAAPAGAREVDAVVLSYVGKNLGSDKRKDVTKGKPYKVNVYQDAGKPTANRAKADLDRDDKWDEKFTFEADGSVTRQVAPNDDEAYTVKFRWDGNTWVEG